MPIRHARRSDIPIMARVLAASFGQDKLFQVMFPHQHEYPEDLVTAFRRSLREAWWDYSKVLMVSYETDGSITGMAEWQRVGLGWERVWNIFGWWDPRCLVQKLVQFRNKICYFFQPCRASARPSKEDPNPLLFTNFVARLIPFSMSFLCDPSKPWRANHWSLEILGIGPSSQGRGHGKELAQWGLSEAKSEGIPSVVISADEKEQFYQKVGFREIVGWTSRSVEDIGINPLEERGVGGGAVLWSWVKEDEKRDALGSAQLPA